MKQYNTTVAATVDNYKVQLIHLSFFRGFLESFPGGLVGGGLGEGLCSASHEASRLETELVIQRRKFINIKLNRQLK